MVPRFQVVYISVAVHLIDLILTIDMIDVYVIYINNCTACKL